MIFRSHSSSVVDPYSSLSPAPTLEDHIDLLQPSLHIRPLNPAPLSSRPFLGTYQPRRPVKQIVPQSKPVSFRSSLSFLPSKSSPPVSSPDLELTTYCDLSSLSAPVPRDQVDLGGRNPAFHSPIDPFISPSSPNTQRPIVPRIPSSHTTCYLRSILYQPMHSHQILLEPDRATETKEQNCKWRLCFCFLTAQTQIITQKLY